jgi:uncharacterized protein (TIGR04255 family)
VTWKPVQQQHAIERVRVELAFAELLPTRVVESAKRDFERLRGQLRFAEPILQETHQFQLQPGLSGAPPVQKITGWQSVREASPGAIVEAVTVNQSGFTYESTDYRGWSTAYKRFHTVSCDFISQFCSVMDIRSFSLDYTDRFIFEGSPDQATPTEIVQPQLLASLTDGAKRGRDLWHVHRGWFQTQDGRSILMNQNIDAQDAKTHTGFDVRSLHLFTRAEFRPKPEQFDPKDLDEIANQLHSLCDTHFSSVLTAAAKRSVGLEGEAPEDA